jgi:DNA polymerase-3 subunit alpha
VPGQFVHCHCHSSYSLLDGLGRIDDLVEAAVAAGMPALALTDHGTMFGAIEFYQKAREADIKPIVGCEVYVSDRILAEASVPDSRTYHLVLIAQNETGYRNLIRLTTEAHLNGYYRKPRVDDQLIESCSDGLICLSGCASSELARHILNDDLRTAEKRADWFQSIFPGRYYLEMQYHNIDFQKKINQGIVHLSQKLGLPLVATNDVHYVQQRHAYAHEVLLCIQTQTTMSDEKRMRMQTPEFYLKSYDEMSGLFSGWPSAISNTLEIAERCTLELTFGRPQLPRYQTPRGETPEEYLRTLCEARVYARYRTVTSKVRERLEYELAVIFGTGFADYILLVYDVIHFARSQGIAVGPGRGSAAGSIVAYVLCLTSVDPLEHGLSFERFLNSERVNMPDMDLDFADDRRDEVIRYVTERYGRDRVAQIITFGTIGPRAGVRDVGRALGMSYPDVDRVAKLIPFMASKTARARLEVPELQQLYESDTAMKRLLDTVEDMEGVARHASTHAAGVVISKDPLIQHVPLYKVPKNDQVITQYAMGSIEQIGLLKLDFLGLRTLTILERACEFVRQTGDSALQVDDIPLDDPAIYELLSSGETHGVFQVDGAGMRKLLRDLRPSQFSHVVAMIALYRPGPMEQIPEFVARKNGRKAVNYDHPALEEVLRETYGIVVYQEQVMQLAVLVAGYTMGEADLLRRAMGKKKADELAQHREIFIERAGKLGTNRQTAEHLFDIVEPFAGYAFNKAHSAAYAVITCQTAYLKSRYPREYMAGLLSAEKDSSERVAEAATECGRLGIVMLPPDINQSSLDFTLEGDGIRFGLSAIKNVGSAAIEAILAARSRGGTFTSLEDFCTRVDWTVVTKRALESLMKSGAFDPLGVERGRLLGSLDRIVAFGTKIQQDAASQQSSLFGNSEAVRAVLHLSVTEAASTDDKLEWERELLGIFLTPHPLAQAELSFRALHAVTVSDVSAEQGGQRISVGGIVRGIRSFATKTGQPMATFKLADLRTSLEVVVFSRFFAQLHSKLIENAIVVVDGKCDTADGSLRLIADSIWTLEEARERPSSAARRSSNGASGVGAGDGTPGTEVAHSKNGNRPIPGSLGRACRLRVRVRRSGDRRADLDRVERVYVTLQRFRGSDTVEIQVVQGSHVRSLSLPNGTTAVCEALQKELDAVLAEEAGEWKVDVLHAPA